MSEEIGTTITPAPNGPLIVKGLNNFRNSKGPLEAKATIALCRCGESGTKPFCDGAHAKVGFTSEKVEGRVLDKKDDYRGKDITIHDNRGICAHAGVCTDGLPAVFRLKKEPWIDPDGAPSDEIIATVKRCPSGALGYSIGDVAQPDQGLEPGITVAEDGPYVVTGRLDLEGEERPEGASTEQCSLCRCGASKNKPFCDGSHWQIKFRSE